MSVAKTIYGDISATAGAALVLTRNDLPITLRDDILIPPLQNTDSDRDRRSCEDRPDGINNDGDSNRNGTPRVDENGCGDDPGKIAIEFRYAFDLADLEIGSSDKLRLYWNLCNLICLPGESVAREYSKYGISELSHHYRQRGISNFNPD